MQESTPLIPITSSGENNDDIRGRLSPDDGRTSSTTGSTVAGATFNFINSIVGAGCIGLGSAIARSGGVISIVSVVVVAVLCKYSFDMVIELSIEAGQGETATFEQLGCKCYGWIGRLVVLLSKLLYSVGTLIAYTKIIKDNFTSAVCSLMATPAIPLDIMNESLVTFGLSLTIMFPMCLLRDVSSFDKVSLIKIVVVFCILGTILSLYITNPGGFRAEVDDEQNAFFGHWVQVRPGLIEGLGTFIFTFTAQHTVNLVFESMRRDKETLHHWKYVSTWSLVPSTVFSLGIGLTLYITFWEDTSSSIFELYPPQLISVSVTKLLLCFMMMFTYPMPFFSSRELVIMLFMIPTTGAQQNSNQETEVSAGDEKASTTSKTTSMLSAPSTTTTTTMPWWLVADRQLIAPLHLLLTFVLWFPTTMMALLAPSLADVLDVVGCSSGTLIGFLLPPLFWFRLRGFGWAATLLFVVGGCVGSVGTWYSVLKLIEDDHPSAT